MRSASTLLPYEREISFPIQGRVEFGRLGEPDPVDPAGTLGVFIDKFGLAGQCFVYTKNFAAYGRIEVACSFDGRDNPDRAAFLHLRANVREFNSGHVAELFLSVVCYPNGADAVLDNDVLVILAVSNLRDRCWTFAPKVGPIPYRSRKDTLSNQLELGLSTIREAAVVSRCATKEVGTGDHYAKDCQRRELDPQQPRSRRCLEARCAVEAANSLRSRSGLHRRLPRGHRVGWPSSVEFALGSVPQPRSPSSSASELRAVPYRTDLSATALQLHPASPPSQLPGNIPAAHDANDLAPELLLNHWPPQNQTEAEPVINHGEPAGCELHRTEQFAPDNLALLNEWKASPRSDASCARLPGGAGSRTRTEAPGKAS
jgi:hypothetical protein